MAKKSIFRDLDTRCGGTGWLECSCGGDQCYCQLNGGIDCSGCPDCENSEDGVDEDDFNGICGCGEFLTSYGNCPMCEPSYLVL